MSAASLWITRYDGNRHSRRLASAKRGTSSRSGKLSSCEFPGSLGPGALIRAACRLVHQGSAALTVRYCTAPAVQVEHQADHGRALQGERPGPAVCDKGLWVNPHRSARVRSGQASRRFLPVLRRPSPGGRSHDAPRFVVVLPIAVLPGRGRTVQMGNSEQFGRRRRVSTLFFSSSFFKPPPTCCVRRCPWSRSALHLRVSGARRRSGNQLSHLTPHPGLPSALEDAAVAAQDPALLAARFSAGGEIELQPRRPSCRPISFAAYRAPSAGPAQPITQVWSPTVSGARVSGQHP